MNAFFRKLSWLAQRRRKEDELREELAFHLEEEAERVGHDAARRELGNITLLREETRSAWGWTMMEQLGQDLRYALRTMAASKSFSLLAILTLALGIGANTAIYSFMDSILLRSLPVADPESLAVLNWHQLSKGMAGTVMHSGSGSTHEDKGGTTAGIFPYPAFERLKKSSDSVFSSLFAYYPTREVNLMVKGQAEQASGEYVSGDYFRGLAVLPAAGRAIIPDDDRAGAQPVVVLSFAYSQKRFGDTVSAPGQSILINNLPFTVIGVAPSGFFGVDPAAAPDFYIPLRTNILFAAKHRGIGSEAYLDQNFYWIEMMARLRPGVNLAQARAALGPVFHQWVATTASNDQERADLPALLITEGASGLDNLRRQYSKPLYVLLSMVALILAIACANIANLLLARAAARRREIAVRLSMGAGRFRVIRQLLTESLLLAAIGGGVGVLLAVWGIRVLTLLLANGREDFTLHPDLNWHVLAAAMALSMITGLLFGLAPALQATRVDMMPALKETRAGQPGRNRKRLSLSHALVILQIAISLLLLVGAGLFVRTLRNLQSIQLGFNRENLLLFQMNARQAGHKAPEIVTFFSNLQKRFGAIPGVRDVAMSHYPMIGYGTWMSDVAPIGKEPSGTTIHILMTGSGFFTAMQIPMLAGREIDQRDQPGSPPVAVINEVFAKLSFGDENPLGQRISIRREKPFKEMEVVGVARNARYGGLKGDFEPVVYVPFNQGTYVPVEEMTFALRTSGDPLRYVNTVHEIVRQADPRVPVTSLKTEAAQVDQIMNQEIVFARLCSAFAILALVIACVGLYGTVSYNVARRTGEIGIRTALGAQRGRLIWMILRDVIILGAVGLAIGIPAALGTSKLVASFLYRIKPNDPGALTIAVLTLLSAALLAGYLPARRASRIDPMVALRHE
ncbi:MAG TPA: ABC transporter permease [Bryobacteraceae bacterium]|jgi:macrolide transport system ATP-binding/permease protein|nr:ABC transporter permease [Bryobacteraceae bacterium]